MNMVSENIFHELDFFAVSFVLGMLLVPVYDCLRIFRRIVRHGVFWISLEDFIYWIATAFAVFAMLYRKNDGLIRGFSIGGVVLGMLLYNRFVSRYTVRCIVCVLEKIIQFVKKTGTRVLAPFWKLKKRLSAKSVTAVDKGRKILKYQKRRLKKMKKEIKIGITKK